MKSKKGDTGYREDGGASTGRMSYAYVLALVEECHRFQDKTYERVSLEELVRNRKLIDEYAATLYQTLDRYGLRSDRRALNALGMELVEASLRLLMLRYIPYERTRCVPIVSADAAGN